MSSDTGKLSKPMAVVVFGAVGLTFYFMLTYSGPFKWFAELQLGWSSSYSEKLTFLLTFVAVTAAGAVLIWPFRRSGGAAQAGAESPSLTQRLGNLGHWGGIIAFLGIVLVALAGNDVWRLAGNTDLADVTIEHLEAGQAPPSHHVKLSGVALVDARIAFSSSGRSSDGEDTYLPVVSENHDTKGGVRAFAKFDKDSSVPSVAGPTVIQGQIAKGGLPGPVRTEYERIGAIPASQTHYLLEVGKNPAKVRDRAKGMLWAGGGILAAGALLLFIAFARAAKSG